MMTLVWSGELALRAWRVKNLDHRSVRPFAFDTRTSEVNNELSIFRGIN